MMQKYINKFQEYLANNVTGGNDKAAQGIIIVVCLILIVGSWVYAFSDRGPKPPSQEEQEAMYIEQGWVQDADGVYMPPERGF